MEKVNSEAVLQRAYGAYGVDMIRTGGGLVRTTPSVIYRAAALFQRFQSSVTESYRRHYLAPEEMGAAKGSDAVPRASPSAVEYTVPEHVGAETLPSGLVPLTDLRAPLDYCVYHLVEHEDVTYLAAACLLVATKMEDPGVRIRPIVDAFSRLADRRAGVTVSALLKPPPERYEDFKSCVVRAEEVLLQELGFQTFVDTPYKYAVVFLNVLVDSDTDAEGQDVPSPRPEAAYAAWLRAAVSWINDAPRCARLARFPAAQLAVYALHHSCPPDVREQLPPQWYTAFGVPEHAMVELSTVYQSYLGKVRVTAAEEVQELRATLSKPPYRKASERAAVAAVAATTAAEAVPPATAAATEREPSARKELATSAAEVGVKPVVTAAPPAAAPLPAKLTTPEAHRPADDKDDDDDEGMDLLALRKKRRREEKERERRERRHKERRERSRSHER